MQDFAIYLPGILLAYSAFLLGIATPGPNVLAVMGTSMRVGRPSGIALALGVAAGSFTWAMLTLAGLSALLSTYAQALIVIKIFGGLYLLWLALKAFRSAMSKHDIEAKEAASGRRTLSGYAIQGYIIMMTNPKAALAWVAIVSLGLQDGAPAWVGVVIVVGTSVMSTVIHTLYAVAFSTQVMVRAYAKTRRTMQAVLGMFFAFAGIKLLISRA